MTSRRRWILGLGTAAAAVAVVIVGSASVEAAPRASAIAQTSSTSATDWSLSGTQLAQARQALMLMATQSDPATAGKSARVTGAWPSNLTAGSAFGTDRAAANAAMGEPGAAPATDAQHPVVCAEGHGQFSTADVSRPAGSPVQTYTYVVICFDPTTGNILDTGYDNKPLNRAFTGIRTLDITSAITSTVH
jgi:hypothetical protein